MISSPILSVVMITYGHENFIEESINGVLAQIFDAEIEVIISDDCSPDNTENIIQNIIKNHPKGHWIKYIKHQENKGAIPNFVWTLQETRGKYVAICEGDDYWTDPLKLQKQVNFLELNPDYILCFHKVKILKDNGDIVDDFITRVPEKYQERITLATNYNYIHTPSVVYRNIDQDYSSISEFKHSPIGDYFLYMILSQYGKIGYINETMAMYRHGSGIYSKLDHLKHNKANLLLYINLYSFEKDPLIKEIFLNHILGFLKPTYDKVRKNEMLLGTRRHVFVEKSYVFFKKILQYFKIF